MDPLPMSCTPDAGSSYLAPLNSVRKPCDDKLASPRSRGLVPWSGRSDLGTEHHEIIERLVHISLNVKAHLSTARAKRQQMMRL